ncbi:MAG: glycosyltransferase family 4 protein, partial [Bacteroidota bacterium]
WVHWQHGVSKFHFRYCASAGSPPPFKKVYFQTTHLRLKQYEEGTIKAGKYDVLIPITKRDQDSFKKIGNRKPSFFANAGIDFTHIPEPEQQLEYPSLYYLGALDWEPNKEGMRWFIKEVWPRVSRAFPEMPFYLAGRNMPPEFSKMKKKNLIVVGEVEDAYEFIRDKGIMVAPILSGSGMRVKIVEAMAHGKGIVATTQAAEGLATKHGDHLLIGDSPGDFFNHIAILVENRNMYNTLGKHARTLAHKFYNNQDIIENLAGFYQRQIRSKNK